jgi:hypothetical protein
MITTGCYLPVSGWLFVVLPFLFNQWLFIFLNWFRFLLELDKCVYAFKYNKNNTRAQAIIMCVRSYCYASARSTLKLRIEWNNS